MRVLLVFVLVGCSGIPATAQEQERKLIDRILKPDMSLQNNAQTKEFAARGPTMTRQARTKSFYVPERRAERQFPDDRAFRAKKFDTQESRFSQQQAKLTARSRVQKADTPYATPAYSGVKSARDNDKAAEVSEFPNTRPFLLRGKSQKALSQQDRPLTIEQVRELLNKNE